ncbi:MAG TPA: phosphoribosylformylglycinamidine synthase subunit PurL [Deltaproteobacteria bacterium]|nr:phosphoribosylformylglycinamidine synthase subunit PurL [Deltaproteobacteria bacterium]
MPPDEPTPEQIRDEQVFLKMGLNASEYEEVARRLGRLPNLTETGIFGVMWSEHCSYKNSKPLLGRYPTEGQRILQGPGEGAGVVDLGEDWAAVFKVESHNHPSAIEPYQGAATGVGGILRDIFSMGARPVAILNSLRFGPLQDDPRATRTRYLFKEVVAGIAGYGNCIGVPTVGGEVDFDPAYSGNPLVNAMGVGLVRHDRLQHGRAGGIGNSVVYVGSATGPDGIHGATFASEELSAASEAKRPAVQVGDPFMGKLLLEACLECYESGALLAVQDMGAAGLTCSSTEMADKGGVGMVLDLDRVPQRAEDMSAYEIMLSESQERMLFVAHPGREGELLAICEKWGVEAAVIGEVIEEPVLRLLQKGNCVAELPLEQVCGNPPVYHRESVKPDTLTKLQAEPEVSWPEPEDLGTELLLLLSTPNAGSKQWVHRQYDSMVRTCTRVRPGSDAAVVAVEGSGLSLAMSIDGNARYVQLDPRMGGRIAVAEAARNVVCAGGQPLAITNGLNFGSPEKPEVFWHLDQAVTGIAEACRHLNLPVTGGNVSLYNETEGIPILPTPMVGVIGLVECPEHVTTQFFKQAGDILLLVGETLPEFGGSLYQHHKAGRLSGKAPQLDLVQESKVQQAVLETIRSGLVASAHDLSHGGLALALVTSCTENLGVAVDWNPELRADLALFSESQSRILISTSEEQSSALLAFLDEHGLKPNVIGQVAPQRFRVNLDGKPVINLPLGEIRNPWQSSLELALTV